jgi:hypothetical protein
VDDRRRLAGAGRSLSAARPDIPIGIPLSPTREEQEALDRALDDKLKICRGC